MDKTEFTNKNILRNKQECRVFADMDSSLRVPPTCHNKSEITSENKLTNNVTSFCIWYF